MSSGGRDGLNKSKLNTTEVDVFCGVCCLAEKALSKDETSTLVLIAEILFLHLLYSR